MKKFIKTFFVQLFTGANVATILLLWASCGVTYLSPESHPRLGLLSLMFPLFLLANTLFVPFWLIFKVKRTWLPVVGLACCFSFVRDYFPVNWPSAVPDSTLTIVSYNSHNMGSKEADMEDGTNIVVKYLVESDADIISLQESPVRGKLFQMMQDAGYECANVKEFALCSRLPVLSYDTLALDGHPAHCLQAYLLDGQDTIMLINPHLESNHFSPEIKKAYAEAIETHERDSIRKGLEPVVDLMAVASPVRSRQVDSIQAMIDEWLPRPVIVCGDFNDTPVSYSHRVLTSKLRSAFRESGNGLGFTFHDKGFPVRIDHILYSGDRWKSYQSSVCDTLTCSDHFPIHTKLGKYAP